MIHTLFFFSLLLESQAIPQSGSGCYTSSSVWSPQQLSCPLMVHSVGIVGILNKNLLIEIVILAMEY